MGPPSKFLVTKLLDDVSVIRVGRQAVGNAASALHVPLPDVKEYAQRNELAWLRQREAMYVQANPVTRNKAAMQGTKSSVSAGRNEFDPYRDRIQAGLLTGDAAAVRQTIKDYRSTFPAAEWPDKLKALKNSVAESNPLRPGGSVKQSAQGAFLSWARKNLPAGEVTRILKLANTYARTADTAGFSIRTQQ
jgi:hypothetical protein